MVANESPSISRLNIHPVSNGEVFSGISVYPPRHPNPHTQDQARLTDGSVSVQQAVIYSFRHRYAYTAHNRPMAKGQMRSPKQCADAMGHDLQTHLKSYARFQTRDLAAAFDEGVSVASSVHPNTTGGVAHRTELP